MIVVQEIERMNKWYIHTPDTWRIEEHPANVASSSSRYTNDSSFWDTNDEQFDHSQQRQLRIKWTRDENKLALYCYFRSNPAKRGYRKRMIETWTEFSRSKATKQRFADQVRTIRKNGWYSDIEILEIH